MRDVDFIFENTPVRVVADRDHPELKLAGLKVGPFEEGKEYEVRLWIARELERAGIARIRKERLDTTTLYKVHWRERVQPVRQLSSLPEDFYPKLRRYLSTLKEEATTSSEKMKEYERVVHLFHDIVNCRLRKIISLASVPAPSSQLLENLTREERHLYDRLREIISGWRSAVLGLGEGASQP